MNFKKFTKDAKKKTDYIVVGAVAAALMSLVVLDPSFFNTYGVFLNSLFTLTFIILTHQTLKHTIKSEAAPYIKVGFVLVDKIDEDFVEKYPDLVRDEAVKSFIKSIEDEESPNKNLVFVTVENIVDKTAIEVNVDLDYKKETFDGPADISKQFNCGTLEKGRVFTKLIENYDPPTDSDEFIVKKITTSFNTAKGKTFDEKPITRDFTDSTTPKTHNGNVDILFKIEKN